MDMKEINEQLLEQRKMFEQFKAANDQRIAEEKKRGDADVVVKETVDRISSALTAMEKKSDEAYAELNTKVTKLAAVGGAGAASDEQKQIEAKAMSDFLRKGNEIGLRELEAKAMSVGSDPDGGVLVTSTVENRIVTRVREFTPMRQYATVTNISSDALEYLRDANDMDAAWVAETQARTDTNNPTLGRIRIPVHELAAQPKASQKLLDDANVDVEQWLATKTADRFARSEGAAFVSGNGVSQPRGFLTYTTAATGDESRASNQLEHVATGTSGGFGSAPAGSDKLLDLIHKLNPAYLANAIWAGCRSAMAEVRKLKDADGNYLFTPSMVAGVPAQLLGYNIVYFDNMPVIGANSLSLAFGNFSEGYNIVDRMGIRMLRDPYTDKPNVKFYTTKRVGGDVSNFDAIKLLKFGTT